MRSDYEVACQIVRSSVVKLKGECTANSEFMVQFGFQNDWKLVLNGERYGDGIFVCLVEPFAGSKFHLWLLMKVFSVLTGESYGEPTLENQMRFFELKAEALFDGLGYHSAEYDRMNFGGGL